LTPETAHEATEEMLEDGGGMIIFCAASLMLALLIGNFLHHFEVQRERREDEM